MRESRRNDGKDGRVLWRAPGIGSRTTPVEYRLRLCPHPDRSSRRRIVDLTYADDTLLLATGREWAEARERAETGLHATVEAIRDIRLRVSVKDGSLRVPSPAKPASSRHTDKRRRRENRIGGTV